MLKGENSKKHPIEKRNIFRFCRLRKDPDFVFVLFFWNVKHRKSLYGVPITGCLESEGSWNIEELKRIEPRVVSLDEPTIVNTLIDFG